MAYSAESLRKIISGGETSTVQFKTALPNLNSVAQEMIAFSNTKGGIIIFGIDDKTGYARNLSFEEIRNINQQTANAASQKIFPPIFIETVNIEGSNVVVVSIPEGRGKPYKDNNGSNDEISHLMSENGSYYADECLVGGTSEDDIDLERFDNFLFRKYKKDFKEIKNENKHITIKKLLENLNLLKKDNLTLAGLLLFSSKRHLFKPQFSVNCVSSDGSIIDYFKDSENPFEGTLFSVFQQTMDFIGRSMRKIPAEKGFNSPTKWEIPISVFEEIIVNALVHRDYFISSTVKVFIFADRVEIVSPGKLPNSLNIENIKNGVSIARNPILLSFAQYQLPYKGLGTGIPRSYLLYPEIELENDTDNERFRVVIKRK